MLKKAEKKVLVKELVKELANIKGLFLTDFQGLPTRDLQDLRAELRKEQANYKVVKISLIKRALNELGLDTSNFDFSVPLSITYSAQDEMVPAKILQKFAKKNVNLKILAGYIDGKFMDGKSVKQFASLPGKQELRGQLVGVIAGSLRGLVSVLSGNTRKLVYALNAIKESKT